MKLVHITAVGQSLMFLHGLVEHAQTQGFEVQAISSPGEALSRFGERHGIVVHEVAMSRTISPLTDLRTVAELRRTLRRIKPDVVVAHMSKAGLLGMLGARLAGVPTCIYHNHGMALFSSRGLRKAILWATERATCFLANRVLTVSDSVRRAAIGYRVCAPDKISVPVLGVCGVDADGRFNPNRYDTVSRRRTRDRYGIPAEALVIGFVGRLLPIKGVAELVMAWTTLRDEFPHAHLLLVGDFDARDGLPGTVVDQLRNDPRIHPTGFLQDTAPAYAAMDIFVLPSYHEGFPVTHMEAAAMSLPAVSTEVPGNLDAVQHGVTGTLVPVHDAECLAAALRSYLIAPEVRASHGRAGRERVLRDSHPQAVRESVHQAYVVAYRQGRSARAALPSENLQAFTDGISLSPTEVERASL